MPETTITKPVALTLKTKKGKPYTLLKEDGQEQGYFIWEDDLGKKAKQAEENGQSIIIDHDGDLNYPTVSDVRGTATHTNGEAPAPGTGNYIKGKTNPDDEKAINARRAIQDAVAAMTHTIPSGATPKDAWDKIGPLYQKIKLELNLESGFKNPGPDYDKDIPF